MNLMETVSGNRQTWVDSYDYNPIGKTLDVVFIHDDNFKHLNGVATFRDVEGFVDKPVEPHPNTCLDTLLDIEERSDQANKSFFTLRMDTCCVTFRANKQVEFRHMQPV